VENLFIESANSELIYVNLRLLSWRTTGLLTLDGLRNPSGRILKDLAIKNLNVPILIDCSGVTDIIDHSLEGLKECIATKKTPIIFTNCYSRLAKQIREHIRKPETDFKVGFLENEVCHGYCTENIDVKSLVDSVPLILEEFIKLKVAESFTFYPEKRILSSTPITTNGFFNARALISSPSTFMWISIALADSLKKSIDYGELREQTSKGLRILGVTLRGSPFAAAVAALTGLSSCIEIVDHMGPRHRIIEEHNLRDKYFSGNYVMVGDFIVGATELKIARTYAQMRGGQLVHAEFIGSALNPTSYGIDPRIYSLTNLTQCVPDARYEFITEQL
jgi:hypothetical protein